MAPKLTYQNDVQNVQNGVLNDVTKNGAQNEVQKVQKWRTKVTYKMTYQNGAKNNVQNVQKWRTKVTYKMTYQKWRPK